MIKPSKKSTASAFRSLGHERRQDPRYPLSEDVQNRLRVTIEGFDWPIRMRNISAGGVSLFLNHRLECGATLTINIHNVLLGYTTRRRARIIYILEHFSGEFIIGCAFLKRLSEDQVQLLVL